ncbi:hypothetical protein H4F52_00665 [Pectobacterium brasiliense]|uniref:hypothetical protein n=1 Tax=Pectobacterium brasiliense TaxID=180957 RepID=UPI00196973A9|nr:hypothetical protein [Pectobacterium brasiliense]MBN3130276.1 hypothetical protein [Pectobacterium brasiliense]
MAMAIFTSLASLASLIGLSIQLYKHKEKPLTYALLLISFFLAIFSAYSWNETNSVQEENVALKNARAQADKLIDSWPKIERFKFVSSGEFRGIVISGMAFLESKKDLFPDTYKTTRSLIFLELEAGENKDENFMSKRQKLEEAAETMITTIKAIQLNKEMNSVSATSNR